MMVHATCDVIATLQMTLHPDESIRKEGESRLEACSRLDGFGISLLQVSVNTDAQTGLRQLALVVLKRLVRDRWTVSAEAEERCICDEEKAQIRAMLPTGLGDAASQVQTATGLVVAEIMKAESFEEWPELMPGLIGVIQQNQDHHVVKGALRAICIMIEDFDQMHVLQLAQQVLPRITELCKSPQASWIEKRQALTIIHATIDTVECVYRSMPEVKGFLKENIVSWLEASLSVLDQPLSEEVQDAWGAVFTALQCLTRIIPLSSQLDNMSRLMQVLSVVWKLNSTLMGLYQRFVLGDDILESQASADEPLMEAVSLQDLVSQYLELLMTIVSYPKLKKVCEPSLHDISELAIGYMIIGNEEMDEWMTDCNAFISSTDDFWGPRSSGGMLLDTIVEAYGTKGGIAVASALQNRMGKGEAACLARDPMYWRHIEASVLALGDISDRILEGRLKKEIVSDQNSLLNPNAMIRILLSNSAYNSTSTPLLLARIFWIAGTFSRVLNREIRQLVFSKISEAIESPQLQPPVYGGIFQALSSLIRYSETEDIEQISQSLMHYLCEMLTNATEETLHLMLETISALIEKCPSAVQSADRIIPIIMRAWIDNFNDPLVGEDAFDLLKRVSMAQGGSAAMMKLAVPTIQSILEAPSAAPLLVSGAIDLIVTLACSGSLLESKGILEVFYPCCMHLLQTSSDEDVIASSSAFLRTILQLGGKEALVWLSPNPEETVNSYIQIVHYLLNQDISDRASRYVGGIVMSLIQATSLEQLGKHLPGIVKSLAQRISSVEYPSTVQSMLSVIFALARTDANALINLLFDIEGNAGAMQNIMDKWIERHMEIRTPYDIKLSVVALGSILLSTHPAAEGLQVKGKRTDTSTSIRTRSKSQTLKEEWSIVPLKVKIGLLLIDSYIETTTQGSENLEDDTEWIEDDEDEEDDSNDDGEIGTYDGQFSMYGEFLGDGDQDFDADLADIDVLEMRRRENDSLNFIDLKEYIIQTMMQFKTHRPDAFAQMLEHCTPTQMNNLPPSLLA